MTIIKKQKDPVTTHHCTALGPKWHLPFTVYAVIATAYLLLKTDLLIYISENRSTLETETGPTASRRERGPEAGSDVSTHPELERC